MTEDTALRRLTIEGLGFGGEGFCQPVSGSFVSVPHTLPGDVVLANVGQPHRGRAWAEVARWEHRAPEHRDPDCPHYDRCSGCALRHMGLEDERRWKLAQARQILTRYGPSSIHGLPIGLVCAGTRTGHRSRGRFRVEIHDQRVRVGLRSTGLDGQLSDVRTCPAQSDDFRRLMVALGQTLDADLRASGAIEAIELWTGVAGALALVSVREEPGDPWRSAALEVSQAHDAALALGWPDGHTEPLRGLPHLPISHPGPAGALTVQAPVGSWVHATPSAAALLTDWVVDRILNDSHAFVLDLCCGTGTLTARLAPGLRRLLAVDEDHRAVQALGRACQDRGLTQVEVRAGRLGAILRKLRRELAGEEHPSAAIINPMRRPLGLDQLRDLPELGLRHLIYLGPAPVSAARDAAVLDGLGYRPTDVAVINLHPATAQFMLATEWRRDG